MLGITGRGGAAPTGRRGRGIRPADAFAAAFHDPGRTAAAGPRRSARHGRAVVAGSSAGGRGRASPARALAPRGDRARSVRVERHRLAPRRHAARGLRPAIASLAPGARRGRSKPSTRSSGRSATDPASRRSRATGCRRRSAPNTRGSRPATLGPLRRQARRSRRAGGPRQRGRSAAGHGRPARSRRPSGRASRPCHPRRPRRDMRGLCARHGPCRRAAQGGRGGDRRGLCRDSAAARAVIVGTRRASPRSEHHDRSRRRRSARALARPCPDALRDRRFGVHARRSRQGSPRNRSRVGLSAWHDRGRRRRA